MGQGVPELTTHIWSAHDISEPLRARWEDLRAANPALYSPYFSCAYTQLIGTLCGNVYVLEVTAADETIALLAFQGRRKPNGKFSSGRPIGAPMTDYHGFICAPDARFDAVQILAQAGIGTYSYSAHVDSGDITRLTDRSREHCAVIDISEGAESWRAARDSSYRRHLKSNRRRIRKSEELGERRFEFNCMSQDVFDQLISWKREKFHQTGKFDVLSAAWTIPLLENLWKRGADAGLRADMHALYFGDRLAAVDLGLSDGTTFHSWVVAYNHEFHHLAPGIQLLEALIDQSGSLGYTRIDLGAGIDGYKRQYASEDIYVISGYIAARGFSSFKCKLFGNLENLGEKHLGRLGKLPAKIRRRSAQINACEPKFAGRAKAMLKALKGPPHNTP
jgi:CelD/BcsL family acetyltransferase involved in cellulose biosynthesis